MLMVEKSDKFALNVKKEKKKANNAKYKKSNCRKLCIFYKANKFK